MSLFRLTALALLAPLLAPAASEAQTVSCPVYARQPQLSVSLYFGRTYRPDSTAPARQVDQEAFTAFLREEVTKRFPAGFTVLDGYGQWQVSSTGVISKEPSTIIELVTPDSPDLAARVEAIASAYRNKFNQLAVGRKVTQVCAAF